MAASKKYTPALKFDFLTRFFDPLLSLTMPEKKFKQALIYQADIEFKPHLTFLDFGCGTATLSIMLKEVCRRVNVHGIDVDPKVLAIARKKVNRRKLDIKLTQYDGRQLPYPDNEFDRVVSSLVFHHLTPEQKGETLEEIFRVLKPSGELHIADWGKAQNPLKRKAFYLIQLLDRFETTTDHVEGRLLAYIENAGFNQVKETKQFATIFGTLSLYKALKV